MVLTRGYQYAKAGWDLIWALLARDTTERKRRAELGYWKLQQAKDGRLSSDHYEYFFTDHFRLNADDYAGKRVLDIGCGPRGSLDWAAMVERGVGLDPLVTQYADLGIDDSAMEYVNGRAEDIPFPDGHFDIVTSFNSLDHVDDLEASVREIKRVTAPGGHFLLITDVNHEPTVTEPVSYGWDVVDAFSPEFELQWRDEREKSEGGVYPSAKYGREYDFTDDTKRYGVLSAKFEKTG